MLPAASITVRQNFKFPFGKAAKSSAIFAVDSVAAPYWLMLEQLSCDARPTA
jgi:hypothetical protein